MKIMPHEMPKRRARDWDAMGHNSPALRSIYRAIRDGKVSGVKLEGKE